MEGPSLAANPAEGAWATPLDLLPLPRRAQSVEPPVRAHNEQGHPRADGHGPALMISEDMMRAHVTRAVAGVFPRDVGLSALV